MGFALDSPVLIALATANFWILTWPVANLLTGDEAQPVKRERQGDGDRLKQLALSLGLPGVDGLTLDGPTAAKIFNGTVTTWNAPEIAALNAGKTLPGDKINVVFRSDESGTTDNFQKYLDAASDGAWGKGAGKTFNLACGEATTLNQLLEQIGELSGRPVEAIHAERQPGDLPRSLADISKAREVLGYEPAIDLRAGLEKIFVHLERDHEARMKRRLSTAGMGT